MKRLHVIAMLLASICFSSGYSGLYDTSINSGGIKPYGLYAGERKVIDLNKIKKSLSTNDFIKAIASSAGVNLQSVANNIDTTKINYDTVAQKAVAYSQMPVIQLQSAISNNLMVAMDNPTPENHAELLSSMLGVQLKSEKLGDGLLKVANAMQTTSPVKYNSEESEKILDEIVIVLYIDTSTELSKENGLKYIRAINENISEEYKFVFVGKTKRDWYNVSGGFLREPTTIAFFGGEYSFFIPNEAVVGMWLYDTVYQKAKYITPELAMSSGFGKVVFDFYKKNRDPLYAEKKK